MSEEVATWKRARDKPPTEEPTLLDKLIKMREYLDDAEELIVKGLQAVDTDERAHFGRETYSRIKCVSKQLEDHEELAAAGAARFSQLAPILLWELFGGLEDSRPKPTSYLTTELKPETVEALNAALANE